MEAVFTWAREVGQGPGELTPERGKEFLQMVVEDVVIDGNNNMDVTLAIPIESKPTTEVSVQNFRDRTNFRTLHPADTIATETSGTPGLSIWIQPSKAGRTDNWLCHICPKCPVSILLRGACFDRRQNHIRDVAGGSLSFLRH